MSSDLREKIDWDEINLESWSFGDVPEVDAEGDGLTDMITEFVTELSDKITTDLFQKSAAAGAKVAIEEILDPENTIDLWVYGEGDFQLEFGILDRKIEISQALEEVLKNPCFSGDEENQLLQSRALAAKLRTIADYLDTTPPSMTERIEAAVGTKVMRDALRDS